MIDESTLEKQLGETLPSQRWFGATAVVALGGRVSGSAGSPTTRSGPCSSSSSHGNTSSRRSR